MNATKSAAATKNRVELHLIQSFAPSCLNRDDTNTPKDCEFGGVRRARISSQCLKRAVRGAFEEHGLLEKGDLSVRTKRLLDELATKLTAARKVERPIAEGIARAAIQAAGLALKEDRTEYLLFLSRRQIDELTGLILESWGVFEGLAKHAEEAESAKEGEAAKSKEAEAEKGAAKAGTRDKAKAAKAAKKDATKQLDKELQRRLESIFAAGAAAPELALFGRMIADKPEWNIEAACQVAHGLSTHRVSVEFDYFTAVDDLKKGDTAGADMIGTVAFNAACFYRYSVVDSAELARHLGDPGTARLALEAFLMASIRAIPTGKQNSMAAHNPPSFVLAVVRRDQPCSLANAFVEPIRPRPGPGEDVVNLSVKALDKHLGDLLRVYGDDGVETLAWVALDRELDKEGNLPTLHPKKADRQKARRFDTVSALVRAVVDAAVPVSSS